MTKKLINILFVAFLLLFPFGVLFRIKLFQNSFIVPQDVVVFFIFMLTTFKFRNNLSYLLKNKFLLFQLLFILTGGASLLINSLFFRDINIYSSAMYLLRYVSYLGLLGIGNFISSRMLNIAIKGAGISFLIIGFCQFFFYNNLRNLFYLGWDDHLYRLFSTFLDPNYAGVFYVLFFLFLLAFIVKNKINKSYFELIFSFFTLIAIYLTYSRTALVSLMAGVLGISILYKKLKLMLLGLSIFSILLFVLSDISVEGLNPLRTASTKERLLSINEATIIIGKNPFFGVGFNAYRIAQVRYGLRNPIGASVSNADAGTDNSWLFSLATTGLLGFAFFATSYYFLLKQFYKEHTIIGWIPFGIVIALLAASMFLNVLFYTPILSFFFILIAARKKVFSRVDM